MRAVVDTNMIVSSYLFPHSKPSSIIKHWIAGAFELVVTEELIGEYERVLQYPHISPRLRMHARMLARSMDRFRDLGTVVVLTDVPQVINADPDDDIVVATAVAGEADFIVSGDKHLLDVSEHQGIRIIAPATFLAILEHDL